MAAAKTYLFLQAADGRYLQADLNAGTGQWTFWLAAGRGCSPCHEELRTAEQYRRAAEPVVGPLAIVEETLC